VGIDIRIWQHGGVDKHPCPFTVTFAHAYAYAYAKS
jgi:hypothetical protein